MITTKMASTNNTKRILNTGRHQRKTAPCGKPLVSVLVDTRTQPLTGLEIWNQFFRNLNSHTGARIAARTRIACAGGEGTKTPKFDTAIFCEALGGVVRKVALFAQALQNQLNAPQLTGQGQQITALGQQLAALELPLSIDLDDAIEVLAVKDAVGALLSVAMNGQDDGADVRFGFADEVDDDIGIMVAGALEEGANPVERLLVSLDADRAEIGRIADLAIIHEERGHARRIVHVEIVRIFEHHPFDRLLLQKLRDLAVCHF
mgnify:CR=1 FL=1